MNIRYIDAGGGLGIEYGKAEFDPVASARTAMPRQSSQPVRAWAHTCCWSRAGFWSPRQEPC